MSENTNCPICNSKAEKYTYGRDGNSFNCERCGRYFVSRSVVSMCRYDDVKPLLPKFSSWISEQNKIYDIDTPELLIDVASKIEEQREKTIKEKFNCFMKTFKELSKSDISINDYNHCYIKNKDELDILYKKALEKNYIDDNKVKFQSTIIIENKITFDGLEYIESLSEINKNSKNVFVAFHFTDEMQNIVDNDLKNAIEDIGFNCTRVSTSTTDTDVHINDEIIGKIKSSKIVIADFSGHRNSVYFEAGYAMGLNIPVIWSCKKDEFEKLSFDTRQYPHILWDTPKDLTKQIMNRIRTII
jgi:nucleoside 2-deoxyribosyltransferase